MKGGEVNCEISEVECKKQSAFVSHSEIRSSKIVVMTPHESTFKLSCNDALYLRV